MRVWTDTDIQGLKSVLESFVQIPLTQGKTNFQNILINKCLIQYLN